MSSWRRLVSGSVLFAMLLAGQGVRQAGAGIVPAELHQAFLQAVVRDGAVSPAGEGGSDAAARPVAIDSLVYGGVKATAADGTAGEQFGSAVAISGDTAIVGAALGRVGGISTGSAYVFTRSGGVWSAQAKLVAPAGIVQDYFGVSVALAGDTAIVGASGADIGANLHQGAAYVFVRSAGTWSLQATLTASDGADNDQFGGSVAISGDTALVGAIGYSEAQGTAYVFTRTAGAWSEQAKLTAADGAARDGFGFRVALSGNTALIGARTDDVGANVNQGSAYAFLRTGGTWTQQGKLTAADGAANDLFGGAVALSGETALVGALYCDAGGQVDRGAAYLFVRSGSTWTEQAKLTASDGAAGDAFGFSVALSGETILVGTALDDAVGSVDQGSAYFFIRSGAAWIEQTKFSAPDGAAGDDFGCSVALSGDTALVGAARDDVSGQGDQGSAYFFDTYPYRSDHDLSASASAGRLDLLPGETVSLIAGIANLGPASADSLFVSAPLPAGLAYLSHTATAGVYDPAAGTWSLGTLPFGMGATLTLTAAVTDAASGTEPAFAAALLGTDTNGGNNSASVALHVTYVGASQAVYDGWVLESREASSRGGKTNAAATTLLVGDDAKNRQYRALLGFDTSALPDNAVVTSATLRLKSAGFKGGLPFRTHKGLRVDIRSGAFSQAESLQTQDFQAAAGLSGAAAVGKNLVSGWYVSTLPAAALPWINTTGPTQLRLRFGRDDDNDYAADYLRLFSGDAAPADRPVLVVEYVVP